jgi:hypothetical protein
MPHSIGSTVFASVYPDQQRSTLVVLPIVLPAVVAISFALLVWFIAEWMTVPPLRLAAWTAPNERSSPRRSTPRRSR